MSSKARFEEHHGQPFLVQASPGFLESVQDPETPESLLEKHETVLKEELARLLARLPPKEAEAITKWLHGMTQAQIAAQDGVTQAAISIRAKRGLEKLFTMRDNGELGTLKFIWDGLHKLRKHIDHEIDLERDSGSDVSLPLGEELGEELGEQIKLPEDPVYVAAKQALVMHELNRKPTCRECGLEAPSHKLSCSSHKAVPIKVAVKRARKSRDSKPGFNEKEAAVLAVIKGADSNLHLKQIEANAKPMIADKLASDYASDSRNSWLRNSLRKLVRKQLVKKLGKGMYAPCGT